MLFFFLYLTFLYGCFEFEYLYRLSTRHIANNCTNYSTDWLPGEPNNVADNEDCVEMTTLDGTAFKWNDIDCSRTDLSTICELQDGDHF